MVHGEGGSLSGAVGLGSRVERLGFRIDRDHARGQFLHRYHKPYRPRVESWWRSLAVTQLSCEHTFTKRGM
jgi:hypothetical protein